MISVLAVACVAGLCPRWVHEGTAASAALRHVPPARWSRATRGVDPEKPDASSGRRGPVGTTGNPWPPPVEPEQQGCSAISGGRLGHTSAREHGHGAQHYPEEPRRSMSPTRVPRPVGERVRRTQPWPRPQAPGALAERSCARSSSRRRAGTARWPGRCCGGGGSAPNPAAACRSPAARPAEQVPRHASRTAQQGGPRRSRPAVSDGRDQTISVSGSPDRSRCPRAGWPRQSPCRARGSRSRRTRSSGTARPSPLRSARR